jgi:hypothetical protein
VRGVALHGLDEVRNEIGAPLILVEHLAPCGLCLLLGRRNGVEAACRQRRQNKRQDQHGPETAKNGRGKKALGEHGNSLGHHAMVNDYHIAGPKEWLASHICGPCLCSPAQKR